MSNETTTPEAAAPAAPPAAPQSPIDRARAILAGDAAPATPEAPAAPVEPEAPTAPTAADLVLGLATAPKPEPSIAGDDPSLAKIMELDRAARQEREQLQADRKAFEEQRAGLEGYGKAAELAKAGKKLEALRALGITYEDLTAEALNGGGSNLEPVTQKLAELERQLAELPKTYEEKLAARDAQIEEQKQAAWKAETARKVASDQERWGLLNDPVAMQGRTPSEALFDVMARHFESTGGENGGEVLTVDAAADMLEASLERQVREAARRPNSKLARLMGLAAPIAPTTEPAPELAAPGPANTSSSPTLTTGLASRAPAGEPVPPRGAEDYKRRALEAAKQAMG